MSVRMKPRSRAKLAPSLRAKLLADRPEGSWCFYVDGGINQRGRSKGGGALLSIGVVIEDPYGSVFARTGQCITRENPDFANTQVLSELAQTSPTSNHAELVAMSYALDVVWRACLAGEAAFSTAVHVIADSSYALGVATGAFALTERNSFLTTVIRRQVATIRERVDLTFGHVRGHGDCLGNVLADEAASSAKLGQEVFWLLGGTNKQWGRPQTLADRLVLWDAEVQGIRGCASWTEAAERTCEWLKGWPAGLRVGTQTSRGLGRSVRPDIRVTRSARYGWARPELAVLAANFAVRAHVFSIVNPGEFVVTRYADGGASFYYASRQPPVDVPTGSLESTGLHLITAWRSLYAAAYDGCEDLIEVARAFE